MHVVRIPQAVKGMEEATVGRWMWNRMHHIEYNDEELKSEWVVGPEIVPPQV